jgi:uncharacterized protein YpuA (DUF1002 family)
MSYEDKVKRLVEKLRESVLVRLGEQGEDFATLVAIKHKLVGADRDKVENWLDELVSAYYEFALLYDAQLVLQDIGNDLRTKLSALREAVWLITLEFEAGARSTAAASDLAAV